VSINQLFPIGTKRRHSGRKLTAILNVEQNSRDQAGCLFGSLCWRKTTRFAIAKVVNRGNSAFVKELCHRGSAQTLCGGEEGPTSVGGIVPASAATTN
jgi:hypothetical protein